MGITSNRKAELLTGYVAYFTSSVGGVSLPPNSFRDFLKEIERKAIKSAMIFIDRLTGGENDDTSHIESK